MRLSRHIGKALPRPAIAGLLTVPLLVPLPAHAYIDPGILGMIYQALYVVVLGGFATFVLKPWRFIKARFGKGAAEQPSEVGEGLDAGEGDA